jgi:hypothetical protein
LPPLRLTALEISRDLADFAFRKAEARPQPVIRNPQTGQEMHLAWQLYESAIKQWDEATMAEYDHQYAHRVKNIIPRLREKGLFNGEKCDSPTALTLIECAIQIQVAAQKLP